MAVKRAVHYLNQFFGQVGGEKSADFKPHIKVEAVGPANLLNQRLNEAEIICTIICGDNYIATHEEEAIHRILDMLTGIKFDIFLAGPAFQAGRYGIACGMVCRAIKEKFNVPVITSMNEENPGVEMFKRDIYILKGGKSAARMKTDIEKIAALADKLLTGEDILPAEIEGYYARGIRRQIWLNPPVMAADRAVDMLKAKLYGKPYKTELPIPKSETVPIAAPVKNLAQATIALITSGGIVPAGNPDRIQSASATKWGKYDISNLDRLPADDYKTIHAGYDPAAGNEDPNRILPLDAMREYEKQGVMGRLYRYFYTTVGTGTTQKEAARMGREIAEEIKAAGIDGVVLTST